MFNYFDIRLHSFNQVFSKMETACLCQEMIVNGIKTAQHVRS
jgi:hypothetical protein